MPPKKRRIRVIAKYKAFDEAAWRRLLIAYAYALYDQRQATKDVNKNCGEGAA